MSEGEIPSDPEALARYFIEEGANKAKKQAVVQTLADEFEFLMDRGPDTLTAEQGWAQLQGEHQTFPDLHHEIHDVWQGDEETVFVKYTLSGTFEKAFRLGEDAVFEPNGAEVEHTGLMMFRIEDGEITAWGYFADNFPVFQEMGIIPPLSELAEN